VLGYYLKAILILLRILIDYKRFSLTSEKSLRFVIQKRNLLEHLEMFLDQKKDIF